MNTQKKLKYERPQVRDLSAMSVSGAGCNPGNAVIGPLGACISGSALTSEECASGTAPAGGTCSPTGSLPELGYCRTGGDAREGCLPTGSIHH